MSVPAKSSSWDVLRQFTSARIALGRCGNGVPTARSLEFELAHARARDAVHLALDSLPLYQGLTNLGLTTIEVHSAARDRNQYLQRPDLGCRLDEPSVERMRDLATDRCDIAFVIADGLSSLAVASHALPVIAESLPMLNLLVGPVVIARQARVALGDPLGSLLGAKMVILLIGERPGLSSADSLGIYLTWAPRWGRSNAERECISNIRPGGLSYPDAARLLSTLVKQAFRRQATGVMSHTDNSSHALSGEARRLVNGVDGDALR